VPSSFNAYNRLYNYSRDPNIPKHRVNWNTVYDLPIGRGKKTPSNQPIYPTPAHPNPSDPNYALYGTNLVSVPLQNGTSVRIAYNNGLNPWRSQYIPGPWAWIVNTSLFR
jgi:hypothetical protein